MPAVIVGVYINTSYVRYLSTLLKCNSFIFSSVLLEYRNIFNSLKLS